MTKTVSAIIPTYNYGHFISTAVESILAQSYPVKEIVVVDDGSTDETAKVIEGLGEKVRYLRQPNSGVSAARNLGARNSTGDLIAFLDADDEWQPEKVERQVAKFNEDPEIGLVYCGMLEFDSDTGDLLATHTTGSQGWIADELLLFDRPDVYVSPSVWIVRRDVFDDVGGFDTQLKVGEDWDFVLRVARKYKVGFVAEPLVNYRRHGSNAHLDIAEMERSTMSAWAKAFDTTDRGIRKLRRRSYGNLHKVLAGSYLHNRQYGGFLRNLAKSLWFRPSFLGYYLTLPFRRDRNTP